MPKMHVLDLLTLVGDAIVEGLGAFVAFWDEVEADTSDVFVGTEGFGIVDFFALDFEFHQAEVPQAHLVAHLKMTAYGFGYSHHHAFEHTSADAHVPGGLFEQLAAFDGLVVNGYGLVLAEGLECRLCLFLDSVFHKFCINWFVYVAKIRINEGKIELLREFL